MQAANTRKAAQCWDEFQSRFAERNPGLFWWDLPQIQAHINSRISGDPALGWPEYTLQRYFADRLPLERCLSLGCGNGHLERTLAQLSAFRACDAYDVSEISIAEARKAARHDGLETVNYQVADVNHLNLPTDKYDAVWIAGAMHHFEALEHVTRQLRQTLKPAGLLILNEYVGPARFQFSARQKHVANLCLQLLPDSYRMMAGEAIELEAERVPARKGLGWLASRTADKIRDGSLAEVVWRRLRALRAQAIGASLLQQAVPFPTVRDTVATDPSEAVRSDEILEVLQQDFEIVERKDWGGNVFQFLLTGIAGNFAVEDERARRLLSMLLTVEDTLLFCGEFESDFAYLVARRRL